jgi:hypothetical protein
MTRCKGELTAAGIDRGWPYQVALPASASKGGGYKTIHDYCKNLSACPARPFGHPRRRVVSRLLLRRAISGYQIDRKGLGHRRVARASLTRLKQNDRLCFKPERSRNFSGFHASFLVLHGTLAYAKYLSENV